MNIHDRSSLSDASPAGDIIRFRLNGDVVALTDPPDTRLSEALRASLGATGTKVGCDAGDCGACTVLVDGGQVCACLVPVGQVDGRTVTTVEGLAGDPLGRALQASFHAHGAAQCGICTPGMLMAGYDLLSRNLRPTEPATLDALGGVLCRCTGYIKIVEAVRAAHGFMDDTQYAEAATGPLPPACDGEGLGMGGRAGCSSKIGPCDGLDSPPHPSPLPRKSDISDFHRYLPMSATADMGKRGEGVRALPPEQTNSAKFPESSSLRTCRGRGRSWP